MPNHVINQVIFTGVDDTLEAAVRKACTSTCCPIDFELLLPVPLNYWMGNVGIKHKSAFPGNALDWCSQNWGTKWNAYGRPKIERDGGSLTLTFKTAWGPPTGWLCALFNTVRTGFAHHSLSEGGLGAQTGTWSWEPASRSISGPLDWQSTTSSPEVHRHMHLLLWGVDEFPPDDVEGEENEGGAKQ